MLDFLGSKTGLEKLRREASSVVPVFELKDPENRDWRGNRNRKKGVKDDIGVWAGD